MDADLLSKEIKYRNPQIHGLWEPTATGMELGDVGIFDTAGEFIPLLNIGLSREENEKRFEGFNLDQSFKSVDELRQKDWDLNAGIHFHRRNKADPKDIPRIRFLIDNDHRLIIQEGTTSGAALVLPGPAVRSDCINALRASTSYFTSQALTWYRYAKEQAKKQGWTVKNGTLVLIASCFWAESWGFATYFGVKTREQMKATFAAREDGNYHREFPRDSDMFGLTKKSHRRWEKQCVAFQGYSIRCEDSEWKKAFRRK